MAKLVHGLEREDEIEAVRDGSGPIGFFEIRLNENRSLLKRFKATAAKLQHLRREVDQRVARDLAILQQRFGEKSRPAAKLKDR